MALAYDSKNNIAGSGLITVPMTFPATGQLLVVTIVNAVTGGARAGGAPYINTTASPLTQVGSMVSGSAECDTEMWYFLDLSAYFVGSYSVYVPNTGSDALNVIASIYKGATACVLDQSTSTNTTGVNPSLTLNNVPAGSAVVDVLGSGYKDVPTANSATLLYKVDNTAWIDAGQYVIKPSSEIIDTYNESNASSVRIITAGDTIKTGQSFTGVAGTLKSAKFSLEKGTAATGNCYAKLYAHSGDYGTSSVPTGAALATSDPIAVSTLPASQALVEFTFSTPYTLAAATYYVITFEWDGSGSEQLSIYLDYSAPTHGGNESIYISSWAVAGNDLVFYVYAYVTATTFSYTQSSDDVAYIMASFKESEPEGPMPADGTGRYMTGMKYW